MRAITFSFVKKDQTEKSIALLKGKIKSSLANVGDFLVTSSKLVVCKLFSKHKIETMFRLNSI